MIWFNLNELEYKISNNDLSDKEGFNYLLAFFILSAIGYSIASNNSNGWITFIGCVISVLINIWGLRTIYEVNKEIDGNDFFKRFFALYWVIGFRLTLLTIPIGFIIGLIMGISSAQIGTDFMHNNLTKDLFMLVFVSLFSVICYSLIINSFQRLKPQTR